jgi:hypothetical protein
MTPSARARIVRSVLAHTGVLSGVGFSLLLTLAASPAAVQAQWWVRSTNQSEAAYAWTNEILKRAGDFRTTCFQNRYAPFMEDAPGHPSDGAHFQFDAESKELFSASFGIGSHDLELHTGGPDNYQQLFALTSGSGGWQSLGWGIRMSFTQDERYYKQLNISLTHSGVFQHQFDGANTQDDGRRFAMTSGFMQSPIAMFRPTDAAIGDKALYSDGNPDHVPLVWHHELAGWPYIDDARHVHVRGEFRELLYRSNDFTLADTTRGEIELVSDNALDPAFLADVDSRVPGLIASLRHTTAPMGTGYTTAIASIPLNDAGVGTGLQHATMLDSTGASQQRLCDKVSDGTCTSQSASGDIGTREVPVATRGMVDSTDRVFGPLPADLAPQDARPRSPEDIAVAPSEGIAFDACAKQHTAGLPVLTNCATQAVLSAVADRVRSCTALGDKDAAACTRAVWSHAGPGFAEEWERSVASYCTANVATYDTEAQCRSAVHLSATEFRVRVCMAASGNQMSRADCAQAIASVSARALAMASRGVLSSVMLQGTSDPLALLGRTESGDRLVAAAADATSYSLPPSTPGGDPRDPKYLAGTCSAPWYGAPLLQLAAPAAPLAPVANGSVGANNDLQGSLTPSHMSASQLKIAKGWWAAHCSPKPFPTTLDDIPATGLTCDVKSDRYQAPVTSTDTTTSPDSLPGPPRGRRPVLPVAPQDPSAPSSR